MNNLFPDIVLTILKPEVLEICFLWLFIVPCNTMGGTSAGGHFTVGEHKEVFNLHLEFVHTYTSLLPLKLSLPCHDRLDF